MQVRFSLRAFLLLFTIVAIIFGGAAHFIYREKEKVRQHKAAIEKLRKKGIEFTTYPLVEPRIEGESEFRQFVRTRIDHDAYPHVGQVMLDFIHRRPQRIAITEVLDCLCDVQCVRELVFIERGLTKENADRLAKLPDLTSLSLGVEVIDAEAAKVLGQMHQLENLQIHGRFRLPDLRIQGGVNDEAMKAIALHSRVKVLDIHANCLSDAGLSAIGKMKDLKTLVLFFPKQLPAHFFDDLAKAPNFEELSIHGGQALDRKQLRQLLDCKKLTHCHLTQTTISEADLIAFGDHPTLREVTFAGALPEEAMKNFLRKKKRRVFYQRPNPDSGARGFYILEDDELRWYSSSF